MRRREFIAIAAGAAMLPFGTSAQQPGKIPRIGVLWQAENESEEAAYLAALRRGFVDMGYAEGRDFILENKFASEQYERLVNLAAGLVSEKVDVLVAVTTPAALAAKKATTKIPIVFAIVPDPVAFKLVDSLAHPGGNLTGVSNINTDLSGKRLELFKEAVPGLSRVTLLANPRFSVTERLVGEHESAATLLGLKVEKVQVTRPEEIQAALTDIPEGNGVVLIGDPMLFNQRKRISEIGMRRRLPIAGWVAEIADAGALISYGSSFSAQFRRLPVYIDKILKGAMPVDLPVEQPTELELVINLDTAKTIGLTVPPTLLTRADRVIE